MKFLILGILFLGMLLNMSSSYRGNDFFQVITSHPHDLDELSPHIETVYQNGRLWVVQLKKNAPAKITRHLKRLTGKEKSYIHKSVLTAQHKRRGESRIKTLVDKIDPALIEKDVIELASYETRAVGTEQNREVFVKLAERLSSMGYAVRQLCWSPGNCSIEAEKYGSVYADEVLLVMAHADSVGETFAGADDNASGTAVLLEMARVLSSYENRRTIRFLISNGEEDGLLGAAHYVRILNNQKKLNQLKLVINMDMVGYNDDGIVEIETNPEFEEIAQSQANLARLYTKLTPKITLGAWGSDHVPFLRRGVPALLVVENWDTRTPCYHLECDVPDTLNYGYAAEIGKMNLAVILSKDQI